MELKGFLKERKSRTIPHNKYKHLIAFILTFLLGAAHTIAPAQKFYKKSLKIAIPGIRDQAGVEWLEKAEVRSPSRKRYWILPRKIKHQRGEFGKKLKFRVPGIDRRHIIRIDDPNDPKSQRLLKKLAKEQNATVIVDMDIGSSVDKRIWKKQTDWAAKVATTLAEMHTNIHPDSHTLLLGHSAGTQAMVTALKIEKEFKKAKKIKRELFDRPIAASPMDVEELPTKTLIILAEGDLPPVPKGSLNPIVIRRSYAARDAKKLARKGHTVLKVVHYTWISPFEAHSATVDWQIKYKNIEIYLPHKETPIKMTNTSIRNVFTTMYDVFGSTSEMKQDAASDKQTVDTIIKKLRENEPTPGIGGISLSAIARFPLDPQDVRHAGYDSEQKRLYLHIKNGKRLMLPPMDSEVLRLTYGNVYQSGKKPELSIGTSHFINEKGKQTVTLHPPGRQPVYYLGNSQNTLLGMVLYLADEALFKLAFGSTTIIQPLVEHVPGFRSLPELFPERYTTHPVSDRFIGSDARIFIHPVLVELVLIPDGTAFEFRNTEFAVGFGNTGPAEAHFAAFFSANFDEIVNTKQGAAIKELIPFAQSVAVFRWLKKNEISFDATGLLSVPIRKVFTPRDATAVTFPSLTEISPSLPTMLFGPFGLKRIIYPDGRQTVICYKNGLPVKAERFDGAVLEIFRDDIGTPVGLRMSGGHEAAFYFDQEVGPVFAENVRLRGEGRNMEVHLTEETVIYPDNQPEAVVCMIISNFSLLEEQP